MRRWGCCVIRKNMLTSLSASTLKQDWRRKMMADLLQNKTPEDCQEAGLRISQILHSMEAFRNAQTISIFISKFPEVDTGPIIRDILESKKTCLIPSWRKSVMKMVPVNADEYDSLIRSRKSSESIPMPPFPDHDPQNNPIDIIILPGLVFNTDGGRIGYGYGYYDRFLSALFQRHHPRPLLIGICHESQLVQSALPLEPCDQLVDMIISPSGIGVSSYHP